MDTLAYDSLLAQATGSLNAQDLESAEHLCRQLLAERRNDPRVLVLLGRLHLANYEFAEAEKPLLKCLKLAPNEPVVHLCLAQVRQAQGRFGEAISRYDKVLRVVPRHPVALIGKAEAYQWRGDYDKAHDLLQPHIDTEEASPEMAHVHAGTALRRGEHERVIELVSRFARHPDASASLRQHLHLLGGLAHERRREFDEAFDAYRRGNEAIDIPSNADERIEQLRAIRECFTGSMMSGLPRSRIVSDLPVFVVGMPRCGSTLVESIIQAHPRAAGAGETGRLPRLARAMQLEIPSTVPFPNCVADLEQEDVDAFGRTILDDLRARGRAARRVVDKTLSNFELIGLIELLLPSAKIIHCRRDPLDTCFSCYTQPLPLPGHAYACDLQSLARVFKAYRTTVEHLRDLTSLAMLEVDYERLVAQPEEQCRRIIEFVGLEWSDKCLQFHASGRQAMTLSDDQVRRPIYTSAVRRSAPFEAHLKPLIDALNETDD